MIEHLCSGLHISTESRALSPLFSLPPLLLRAGQNEGETAKLMHPGEPPAALPTQQGFSTKQGTLAGSTPLG